MRIVDICATMVLDPISGRGERTRDGGGPLPALTEAMVPVMMAAAERPAGSCDCGGRVVWSLFGFFECKVCGRTLHRDGRSAGPGHFGVQADSGPAAHRGPSQPGQAAMGESPCPAGDCSGSRNDKWRRVSDDSLGRAAASGAFRTNDPGNEPDVDPDGELIQPRDGGKINLRGWLL